jgi:hypothetical protein
VHDLRANTITITCAFPYADASTEPITEPVTDYHTPYPDAHYSTNTFPITVTDDDSPHTYAVHAAYSKSQPYADHTAVT